MELHDHGDDMSDEGDILDENSCCCNFINVVGSLSHGLAREALHLCQPLICELCLHQLLLVQELVSSVVGVNV